MQFCYRDEYALTFGCFRSYFLLDDDHVFCTYCLYVKLKVRRYYDIYHLSINPM